MSIKPIDFQVMMPKAPEVSKIHSDEQGRNQAAQQQMASTVQNHAESNIKQVHSQDKAQEAKIREKQQKEREESKKKKKSKGNYGNSGSSKVADEGESESFIDIRL